MLHQQAKSQQPDVDPLTGLGEERDKSIIIALLAEDSTASVATVHDVVAVTAQGVASSAGHGGMIAGGGRKDKSNVPCPLFLGRDYARCTDVR